MEGRQGNVTAEVCFGKVFLPVLHAGKKLEGGRP